MFPHIFPTRGIPQSSNKPSQNSQRDIGSKQVKTALLVPRTLITLHSHDPQTQHHRQMLWGQTTQLCERPTHTTIVSQAQESVTDCTNKMNE